VPIVKVNQPHRNTGRGGERRQRGALGANVALLSVVGDDEPGRKLAELISSGRRRNLPRQRHRNR
jgi:bifunctional ADP-heptose synthase (sugar kinase/adenylyltransferase)